MAETALKKIWRELKWGPARAIYRWHRPPKKPFRSTPRKRLRSRRAGPTRKRRRDVAVKTRKPLRTVKKFAGWVRETKYNGIPLELYLGTRDDDRLTCRVGTRSNELGHGIGTTGEEAFLKAVADFRRRHKDSALVRALEVLG